MKIHRIAKKFISLALIVLMLLPFPAYATENGGEQKSVCEFCGQSYSSLVKHICSQVMCLYCNQSFDRNTGHTCTATTYTCSCGEELMQNTHHMHFMITCSACGKTYADYEKHNCQNYATVTCDKCGDSYLDCPGYTHYCPVTCEKCGYSYTPPIGHKCGTTVCYVCGQLYFGASSNHNCPGGKVCDKCGEKYETSYKKSRGRKRKKELPAKSNSGEKGEGEE